MKASTLSNETLITSPFSCLLPPLSPPFSPYLLASPLPSPVHLLSPLPLSFIPYPSFPLHYLVSFLPTHFCNFYIPRPLSPFHLHSSVSYLHSEQRTTRRVLTSYDARFAYSLDFQMERARRCGEQRKRNAKEFYRRPLTNAMDKDDALIRTPQRTGSPQLSCTPSCSLHLEAKRVSAGTNLVTLRMVTTVIHRRARFRSIQRRSITIGSVYMRSVAIFCACSSTSPT